jgi:membrane protein implicated in regulation of membrane protease activity
MTWWAWFVLGMVLLGGETALAGGFYLLFFGLGALLVGVVGLLGIALPGWAQWLLFSASSVGSLALVRPRILGRFRQAGPGIEDTLVGEIAVAGEPMAPGGTGRGEMRGSSFSLRNAGDTPIAAGQRCRVVRVDGLMLEVRKESAPS